MSAVNFAVALYVNRLIRRLTPAAVLTAGVALTLAGMAWLSRAGAGSSYLTAVALPMVLIGAGQGLAFAPMTSAGLSVSDVPTPAQPPAWSTPSTRSAAPSVSPSSPPSVPPPSRPAHPRPSP